jgi:signal peptidase II
VNASADHSLGRSRGILAMISLSVLVLDQVTKYLVSRFTEPGSLREIVPGLLNLAHTSNPGVAFGFLADSKASWRGPLLISFSLAVMIMIVWILATHRAGGVYGQRGMALVLGGAAGNLLDRFMLASVTDFIDFHIGSYHWYTFNVADSAIVIGAGLIVVEVLRDGRQHAREERA